MRLLAVVTAFGLLVAPHVAEGQTPTAVHRVGIIHLSGHHHVVADGLRQGLRELGLEEGKNIVLDIRQTTDDLKTVEKAARELEQSKVDVIYTVTTPVTIAAKRATVNTPIVFSAGTDPIALGLVESLAKPGGRLTGIHGPTRDLTAKRLQVLKEIIPKLNRVVTFYSADEMKMVRPAREAARQLGVQLIERPVSSLEDLRRSLQALKPREVDAYFHTPDILVTSQAVSIIEAARVKKLPTMFHEVSLVSKGALASYGHNYHQIGRMSAKYVQRILAGTPSRDLPVESYDKIELALNLRTAREIGLTIPSSVGVRADRLIE